MLFAIVHSALAAESVRAGLEAALGGRSRLHRALYNLLSVGILVATWFFSRGEYPIVWRAQGVWRALAVAVQAAAFAGVCLTIASFDIPAFLGLRREPLDAGTPRRDSAALQTQGMYAICRHPLYLFTSLFFSTWPTMDWRKLVIAIWLWSYAYLGSVLEERKLVRVYGEAYRRYQAARPRILPFGRR